MSKQRTSKAPKPQADAGACLKARLHDLASGELAARFEKNFTANDPLVDIRPRGLPTHYGPMAPQVAGVLAEAYNDGLFSAPIFQGLRERIAPHVTEDSIGRLPIVAATVNWLRARGHTVSGGWATEIRQAGAALALECAKTATTRRRRVLKKRPLTGKQTEAYAAFGDCDGNKTLAAERLNITRATFDEHYNSALNKLGEKAPPPKPKTQRLPTGTRGQPDLIAGQDDGPAASDDHRMKAWRDNRAR